MWEGFCVSTYQEQNVPHQQFTKRFGKSFGSDLCRMCMTERLASYRPLETLLRKLPPPKWHQLVASPHKKNVFFWRLCLLWNTVPMKAYMVKERVGSRQFCSMSSWPISRSNLVPRSEKEGREEKWFSVHLMATSLATIPRGPRSSPVAIGPL